MKRRQFVNLLGAAALWPLTAHAQTGRVRRIGLMATSQAHPIERFRKKLGELGYIEGKNLIVEYRYAEGNDDLYPSFAAELVGIPVELIVVWGTPAAFAAKRATSKIPILLGAIGDVINTGLVSDLAHPQGNITGFVALNADLEGKRLEVLKEMLPRLARIGVLGNRANPLNKVNYDTVRRAAEKLGVSVDLFEISNRDEVDAALAAINAAKPDAVIVASDTLLLGERQKIVNAFDAGRIPAIYRFREYAPAGELPVQLATRFEIIINMKTAKKLGLSLPATVLTRADEVIE